MTTIERIKAEIQRTRDEWIKDLDPEWHAYNKCLYIIDEYAGKLPYMLEERIDADTVVFRTLNGEEVEYVRKEPSEDAVSRQAVLDAVSVGCQEWRGVFQRCEKLIDKLPSVQPKAKTGRWIKDGDKLKCPICGAKGENIKDDYCYNFCPVCGARMVSE